MRGVFQIGDKKIKYVVKKGNSLKYLEIKLKPNLELEIILPSSLKVNIKEILERKRSWIEKKYNEMLNKKKTFSKGVMLYRGEPYNVKFISNCSISRVELDCRAKTVIVYADRKSLLSTLEKWIRKETRNYVARKVGKYVEMLGLKYNRIYILSLIHI